MVLCTAERGNVWATVTKVENKGIKGTEEYIHAETKELSLMENQR